VLGLCVDGRPLEVDIKVDSVALPPSARLYVGVPNVHLASIGIQLGILHDNLPTWEAGSILLISTILGPRDALSIYSAGPDFHGQFWGDRPQRLSLPATATSIVSMLAESGEKCSVAAALKRRNISEIEAASHVVGDKFFDSEKGNERNAMLMSVVGLFCYLQPEQILCALHPSSFSVNMREGDASTNKGHFSRRLVNVARINSNSICLSTDAIVYGTGSIIVPSCFADNVQWIGGPNVLLPIVNATKSTSTLALSLRVIRESAHRHIPNLEMLQGGGYRILAFLLYQKRIMTKDILEQCFAFAVHGFTPNLTEIESVAKSTGWALADPDALKYFLMNHQVWSLHSSGPEIASYLLSLLNGLVQPSSIHGVFNARRLHLLGIVKWTLHLMIEIAELYTSGSVGEEASKAKDLENFRQGSDVLTTVSSAFKSGWHSTDTLSVTSTSVGGDPGIPLLLSCKTLLRNVLARMLTPEDLADTAGSVIYTVSVDTMFDDLKSQLGFEVKTSSQNDIDDDCNLRIGAVTRIYLTRLLEELVVDGVNEIASTASKIAPIGYSSKQNLAELSSLNQNGKQHFMTRMRSSDETKKQKEQSAQLFLSAFSTALTPSWFACVLEGCQDEASASAVFRLLIVMLQSSSSFTKQFQDDGGFAPLVLSIPKYSTSPSIMLSMLSQLLHAPILHLPSFGALDTAQLCSIFDTESDAKELILHDSSKGGLKKSKESLSGVFGLLAECLGRNIQVGASENDLGLRARKTNEAVLRLLTHRHCFSSPFQDFCSSPDFLEPLAQALCLVHSGKILGMESTNEHIKEPAADDNASNYSFERSKSIGANSQSSDEADDDCAFVGWPSSNFDSSTHHSEADESEKLIPRRGHLSTINMEVSPTVRFVGGGGDSTGVGLVNLLTHVISHAVKSGPQAATLIDALFKSFPLHASPSEIEAFHLVLIDQCRSIVNETVQRGSLIAFANCVGISSVLLHRLLTGFFASEPILATFNIILSILESASKSETYAFRILTKEDSDNLIRSDVAHFARMISLVALRRSKPNGPWDHGDEILQQKVIEGISKHLKELLYSTKNTNFQQRKKITSMPELSTNQRAIWESSSLDRCLSSRDNTKYPDIYSIDEPDRAFIVSLMSELHSILISSNKPLRQAAVTLVVSMLKLRQGVMSDLLIKQVPVSGGGIRKIDLFHGGGFGALLHHDINREEEDTSLETLRLQTFFDWLNVNDADVDDVFTLMNTEALERMPNIYSIQIPCPEDAIEEEQKDMFLHLSSKKLSDKVMMGSLNRNKLSQESYEKTYENQLKWRRQGLDDLSSGAMQWKALLRQLKGSCSLWEGNSRPKQETIDMFKNNTAKVAKALPYSSAGVVSRWKLDVSEGYERQRRKLLPNYEFDSLYHVDDRSLEPETTEKETLSESNTDIDRSNHFALSPLDRSNHFALSPESVEVTAELLKNMKLAKSKMEYDDEDYDYEDYDDIEDKIDSPTEEVKSDIDESDRIASKSSIDSISRENSTTNDGMISIAELKDGLETNEDEHDDQSNVDIYDGEQERIDTAQNNYDLITGLLHSGDIPEKSYNVQRCTGLEVCPALFIRCRHAIYVIDGFEQTDKDGLRGNINRVEKSTSTFYVSLRPKGFKSKDTESLSEQSNETSRKVSENKDLPTKKKREEKSISSSENFFQHRCKRLALTDIHAVYRRRYQLKQIALEVYDAYNNGTFIAFTDKPQSEEVLHFLLSTASSNSNLSSVPGTSSSYDKFMKALRSKITSNWVHGKMTNFDFLMHLNSFAGRSYNDLTQYPVFPWVLADYESDEIDLSNPLVYRDLSKPMGALGAARAEQFRERYDSLATHFFNKDDPPPFHYGTHYSCAAYVLNYLFRIIYSD